MVLLAILLLSGLALVAVESVGYVRGGYNSAFWKLPLDAKLDHVAEYPWEWWWISVWGLVGMFLLSGGVFGLVHELAEAGEPVLAFVAVGGYAVAAVAWIAGLIIQAASVSQAARQRAEAGTTPSWLHPFWQAGYFAELAWIAGANIAYALIGVAILQTGLVAAWAGWVTLVGGIVIAMGVLVTREGFPQLGYLPPAVIGVAMLMAHL